MEAKRLLTSIQSEYIGLIALLLLLLMLQQRQLLEHSGKLLENL